MLRILALVSIPLLGYEILTVVFAILAPLVANPNAIQTDFHYYYEAARRFSDDASRLYLASDDVIAGFTYPPPAIVPFLLLSKLPLGWALLLMTAASYGAIILSMQLWWGYLRRNGIEADGRTRIAVLLIVLASGPVYMNSVFGQVNAFVLLSAVAFVTRAVSSPAIAGAALAAGTWLKIYPIFLIIIGVMDLRTVRAIAIGAVAAIAIAVALLPVVPLPVYEMFAMFLPGRAGITALHVTNQSLMGFFERFRYPPDQYLNWTGHEAVTVTSPVRAVSMIIITALIMRHWWNSLASRTLSPAIAASMIALIGVIAPLGWGHAYVMVLPLVMLLLIAMPNVSRPLAITIVLCVVALMIPAGRHLPIDAAPAWLQNVVYSRYLIATVTLIVISSVSVGRTTKSMHVASA